MIDQESPKHRLGDWMADGAVRLIRRTKPKRKRFGSSRPMSTDAAQYNRSAWYSYILGECLVEANGDVQAALQAAGYILATQPIMMSVDASGHEHQGKGEGGGQFTFKNGTDKSIDESREMMTDDYDLSDPDEVLEYSSNWQDCGDGTDINSTLDDLINQAAGGLADYSREQVKLPKFIESHFQGMSRALKSIGASDDDLKTVAKVTGPFQKELAKRLNKMEIRLHKTEALAKLVEELEQQEPPLNPDIPEDQLPPAPEEPDEFIPQELPDEPEEPDEPTFDDDEPARSDLEGEGEDADEGFANEHEEWTAAKKEHDAAHDQWEKAHVEYETAHEKWNKDYDQINTANEEREVKNSEAHDEWEEDYASWEEKVTGLEDKWAAKAQKIYDKWESGLTKLEDKLNNISSENQDTHTDEVDSFVRDFLTGDYDTEIQAIVNDLHPPQVQLSIDTHNDEPSYLSIDAHFAHDIRNRRAQGILNRTLKEARGLSASARRDLAAVLKRPAGESGAAILKFVDHYRLQLARLLTDTQLAALLEGAQEVADKVPPLRSVPIEGLPVHEQESILRATADARGWAPDADDGVHYPTIDAAVKNLSQRGVVDRARYDGMSAAARAKAFTVANVAAEETLAKIRDSLAQNVNTGADYETWKNAVLEEVDAGTFLSDNHMETVHRTNIQTAFSDGQMSVLSHPLVRSGFPYSTYDAIHDDRAREDHLALERHGIGGTNVYRNDDPVFQMFRPPWDYNDRCGWTPITVQHAAELGIAEAEEWVATGVEPAQKAHVEMPPFQPPEGFRRSVSGLPLSVQLSLQPMSAFSTDAIVNDLHQDTTLSINPLNDRQIELTAEIIVAMFGDDAEQAAEDIVGTGELDAAFATGGTPVLTRRYGKQPGPNWVSGGVSAKGKQVWLWTQPGGAAASPPAPIPTPVSNTPTATPPPPVHAPAPTPPAPTPAPVIPSPIQPTATPLFTFVPVHTAPPASLPAGGQRARASSIVAYNTAMTKLGAGQQLTVADKASLATKLTNMPSGMLKTLHLNLGGSPSSVSGKAMAASVKSILTGITAVPVSVPTPVPPTPSATPPSNTPSALKPMTPWIVFSTPYPNFNNAVNDALSGKVLHIKDINNAEYDAATLVTNADTIQAITALGGVMRKPYSTYTLARDLHATLVAASGANKAIASAPLPVPTPTVPPPPISPRSSYWQTATLTTVHTLTPALQDHAGNIRAIVLASHDKLMTSQEAVAEITKILGNIASKHEDELVTAFGAKSSDPVDIIAAIIITDPNHVGKSPPGPPPRPGLVWDANSHRWTRPVVASTPAAKGSHYQPPPPKLIKAQSYIDTHDKGKGGSSGGLPTTIDHTVVGSYPKTGKPLNFKETIPTTRGWTIVEHNHTASGYRVLTQWKYGTQPVGGSGEYSINVFDGGGQFVSSYASGAARDETYIKERANQVANWLDDTLNKQTTQKKQGATTSAPIAQFAHEYAAAAGVVPGKVPFKIDAAMDRTAVRGFLSTAFPKLVGSVQHSPHGGMDVVEHTMNIVDPANLRVAGLSTRDAELLRLGMVFHDVGKQYDPLDHEHPRKSAVDAEPMLWQFGLTPREVSDTIAVIKWHDAYGDAMKAGAGPKEVAKVANLVYEYTDDTLPDADRQKDALRINNLLMRAYQSDVSTIPGLTSKPVPGRPDIKVSGFLDVDKVAPAFEAKVAAEVKVMLSPLKSILLPKKPPTVAVGTSPPNLVANGKKWGELVQRDKELPIGDPTPYDSTVVPPPEVYDEARGNPDLNYARAFNMGYDGATGTITTGYHGTDSSGAAGIVATGLRSGNKGDNAFGHGVYVFVNGADTMTPAGYNNDNVVQVEIHTGRIVDHEDLNNNILPKWKKANPTEYAKLAYSNNNGHLTAAALWAGYSTISHYYYSNEPFLVVLDPARIRVKNIAQSKSNKYAGTKIKTPSGNVTFNKLTTTEIDTPKGHIDHMPTKNRVPQGFSGDAKTTN